MRTRAIASSGLFALLFANGPAWPAAGQEEAAPLVTRWGREVTAQNAWREYPRPQLVRAEWECLNGAWEYAITDAEAQEPADWDGEILVPFCAESRLSEVGKQVGPEQALWYRRGFEAPRLEGQRLLLHFGAVDWHAKAWLNGHELGEHRGGYDPFAFDVTGALTDGRQELVVRVWDPTDAGYQPRGKQVREPRGIWYTAVTGIWQTVWLETVPASHVRALRIVPDHEAARVAVTVESSAPGTVELVATAEGREVARASGRSGEALTLEIDEPRAWSPDDPFLYGLEVRLTSDGTTDAVRSYFGLRDVALRPDAEGVPRLFLNGAPLFQYGTLDQGWWPDGLYTAPSDAALRYDLELTKALGFNMIRKHVKVEPARWYAACDELGLLVWQDMPSGDEYIGPNDADIARSNESAAGFEGELRATVDALFNHPSVVMWVPYNEGWGQWDTARVCELLQRWDPTRLVNAASGWTDRGVGDVHDVHAYPGPAMPPLEERRAAVLGEFGGLGLPVRGHTWQTAGSWGYTRHETPEELTAAYVELIARLRPLVARGLSAAVYTQTTDVEIEVNGLLTYDREVLKMDRAQVAAANARLFGPPPIVETIAPTSEREAQEWRYTFAEPPGGWAEPEFDDRAWQHGPGGFGRAGTPGAVVRTPWEAEAIWLRRAFEVDELPAGTLHLRLHHDEDVEVHLNGARVLSRSGWVTGYVDFPLDAELRGALRSGTNTLAVRCRQTGGGQYVDVGLVAIREREETRASSGRQVDYPYEPVPFNRVRLDDGFWAPRLETNRRVTVGYDFRKCEETGRIANFARAGGLEEGAFQGIPFNDSDVFKVMEGAAYSLAQRPDPELRAYLDGLIAKVAAAQEEDGYLYTARTLGFVDGMTGPERWSHLAHSHELYNVGHLYEAAVAHYLATGERTLLDVATRNADLLVKTIGPGEDQLVAVPGHEEIEIGLAKLYRVTGQRAYLDLARFFVERRGRAEGRELYGDYSQDHAPIVEQASAVGHAVRAGYLYAGVADVAALTGDADYVRAIDRIWRDVVGSKLYVTGGIGARRGGEAFGEPYELPNATAYTETCAAIACALWNQRMFQLHGDARYVDVLERVIYNGFLSGVSLSGDRFFYPNPLAWDGRTPFNQGSAGRSPWFSCSCCPVNVVRFLPSIAGSFYATRGDSLYVNLYAQGEAEVELGGRRVGIRQETRYPWDGRVRLVVTPEEPAAFTVRLRIPGWALGRPVPSDLYRYASPEPGEWTVTVGGARVAPELEHGYAVLRREWHAGDVVELALPMPVRRVLAHEAVDADRGRVALERGPLVYCLEGADHDGRVSHLALPDDATLSAEHHPDLLGGVTVVTAEGVAARRVEGGALATEARALTAVPYYAWAHRAPGEMAVWLPREVAGARPVPLPTLASRSRPSASHVWAGDSVDALNDLVEPEGSADHSIPRFTWWDHRGANEWVQYDLPEPTRVSGVDVYWFDDTGRGACRLPASWRVLTLDGDNWRPVRAHGACEVAADRYVSVDFAPVTTRALRLEVGLREGFSAGILEWRLR